MLQKITHFVGSKTFFYGTVVLLVLQALWIALSAHYPMAFDEDFHFGIIQLYAHHLSPFWDHQPANADVFGAVFRDPSYLYHYLMSFPYRLVSLWTSSQTVQVLVLRCINIAMLAGALPLFRRLLGKTGASSAVVHTCLALFVLIPIVPFTAGQISYDNLFILLTAVALLLTARINDELTHHSCVNVQLLLWLVLVMLLASLVKYAFLPIAVGVVLFVVVRYFQCLGRRWASWRRAFGAGLRRMGWYSRVLLVVLLVVAGGLFAERYGVNLVHYHKPVPNCDQVLSVQQCSAYGPWMRDYTLSMHKTDTGQDIIAFMYDWLHGMWLRTFFTLAGPDLHFETRGPLPVPSLSAIALVTVGGVLLVVYGRRIFRRYHTSLLWLFVAVVVSYVGILWVDEYAAYRRTGQAVAINGRYLLPVWLPVMLVLALAYREALARRPRLLATVAGVSIVCFLWGGGALTYVLRSRDAWYWPNHTVMHVNGAVRGALAAVVPGAQDPTMFLH